jgi:YD repeat-containing protein
MLKDLLDRARRLAEEHLPEDVLDAGRKLGRTVAAHAPAPLAEVIHYVTGEPEPEKAEASERDAAGRSTTERDAAGRSTAEREAAEQSTAEREAAERSTAERITAEREAAERSTAEREAAERSTAEREREAAERRTAEREAAERSTAAPKSVAEVRREDPASVLERVKAKAERGLKPEDRLVVVYATPDEEEDVQAILAILATIEAEVRQSDLRREPQTARQLAKLTGVMVPPYVFINGRHWGNRYDLESLAAWGDLPLVAANLLDEISDEARRLGHVHESFSDELSVPNILRRWKLGHILCVDDLDSWYEVDRDRTERFFYQGGPHPVEDMPAVAEEIVRAVEAEEFEAVWQLEPSVQLP